MKLLRGKLTRLFTRAEPGTLLTNLSQNEYYHSFIIRFLHISTSIKKNAIPNIQKTSNNFSHFAYRPYEVLVLTHRSLWNIFRTAMPQWQSI